MNKYILPLSILLALGCGGAPSTEDDGSNPETSAAAAVEVDDANADAARVTVTLGSMTFSPSRVTVAQGTTVRFRNTSGLSHTVTSGAGSADPTAGKLFDQVLRPGKSVSITFSKTGTVPYFCRPHESHGMKGSIVVQ
jgi:plastocyanin